MEPVVLVTMGGALPYKTETAGPPVLRNHPSKILVQIGSAVEENKHVDRQVYRPTFFICTYAKRIKGKKCMCERLFRQMKDVLKASNTSRNYRQRPLSLPNPIIIAPVVPAMSLRDAH